MNSPGSSRDRLRDFFSRTDVGAMLITVAALCAYANSLRVPFLFDDSGSILENASIRELWPLSKPLSPPGDWGFTVSGRPILNLSLAINYAIGGFDVRSYHAFNAVIHILAGLTLFGLIRRTLALPSVAGKFSPSPWSLPLVAALGWTLHPLQTESVTYLVQRAESLMGLFVLFTLYAFVRSLDSPHPFRWRVASVSACLLGVGTKEVTALAPLLVLVYDRTFVSGSFRAAWKSHRGLLLALAATWGPLGWLVAGTGGNRGGTIGFDIGTPWLSYWLTQLEAITRYVGLSIWPHPLVFEYGKIAPPTGGAVWGWAIPVVTLLGATGIALRRWPVAGFLGFCFFGLLAPTSLVPGANQMIVEHRMYLSLAAVLLLLFGAAAKRFPPRFVLFAGLGLALIAGVWTARRNVLYQNEQALWEDTIAKRPQNARAHNNLGRVYYNAGRLDDAIAQYRESVRLDPTSAHAHYNFGLALMAVGRLAEAAKEFGDAVRILPANFNAQLNLGLVLTQLGRAEEALPVFAAAIHFDPAPAQPHLQCGVALAALRRWQEAIEHYAAALKIDPAYAEAQSNWGVALFQLRQVPAAIEHFQAALQLKPAMPDARFNLGLAYASSGRLAEAVTQYLEAIRLNPAHGEAELNLGIALGQMGQLAEATAHLEKAVQLRPGDARAYYNAGYALLAAGRKAEARAHFESALKLQPNFPAAAEMLRQTNQE